MINTIGDSCYLLGGASNANGEKTTNRVTKFTLTENGNLEFEEKASMIHTRCAFGCAYNFGTKQIIVCGGVFEKTNKLADCELYDEESNQWIPLPKLNHAITQTSVCFLNNKHAYSFGGFQNKVANKG